VIIATAVLFAMGSLGTSLAHSIDWLIAGRVVVGVAIGIASFAVPLYISEISPARIRGSLVSLNQLMITIGIVVSYFVDDLFAPVSEGWRYMFACGAIPAAILGFGMLFLPGTPRWLMRQGREKEARNVLEKVSAGENVDADLRIMRESLAEESGGGWSEIAVPWMRPVLIIGIGIMVLQQMIGINTVIYYAPTIFQMAGFRSATAAISATVGVGLINVLMTVVAIRLIDRWGRKPLLYVGLTGMVISLLVLGVAFEAQAALGASLIWVAVGFIVL
jgi:sugar porter (SP) family MFS transporter